ncbi:MAG TPA: acyl-CoA thioesterase [Kofleriaceae bacterium]|nr:acyl-CoA thioesterase [Kofleriaceae bacterium]
MTARHTMEIIATDADLDELGHVSNLVYIKWILDAAMSHSRAAGWDFADYRALGAVFVVRRHEVDYIAQVVAGETLVATTWVESWRAASCIRATELVRDGNVVARGATTWAMMSMSSGRPLRIPDQLLNAFTAVPTT